MFSLFPALVHVWVYLDFQVRVENVDNPSDYIDAVLSRVKNDYVEKTYKLASWSNAVDFLEQLAFRTGKLLKVRWFSLGEKLGMNTK